jgi:hypothetical protein
MLHWLESDSGIPSILGTELRRPVVGWRPSLRIGTLTGGEIHWFRFMAYV